MKIFHNRHVILCCTLVFQYHPFLLCQETFADYFKPISLEYLYRLVDNHPEKKEELNEMFRVEKIYNLKSGNNKKVLSFSLFWKAGSLNRSQPEVNERTIYMTGTGVKYNESFYDIYLKRLIKQLKNYKKIFKGWTARLYLAHDLKFLLPWFMDYDVEIFLMASNSIRANPGAMWRFLVFDDPSVSCAFIRDADLRNFDDSPDAIRWINRSETRGFFRVLAARKWEGDRPNYSPIMAGRFGGKNIDWVHMEKAMKGFILHKTFHPDESRHPTDLATPETPYGWGNRFPDYGFDERFLKHVIYFEAVKRNQLTILPPNEDKKVDWSSIHPWIRADFEFIEAYSGKAYYHDR